MRREALITASTCHFTIYFAYCYFKNLRGRWFDFCGKGMGDLRKKIYPVDWFRGEKRPALKIMYTYRYIRCISGKESNSRGLGRIFLPKPNHSYPPPPPWKVKWSALFVPMHKRKGPHAFPWQQQSSSRPKNWWCTVKDKKKTYQKCTVKLINIWCFTENKQFSLDIYW